MSKEELMLEHNKMITEILEQCNYIMENRKYLTDTGIKNCTQRIIDIVNKFFIEEAKWR